jgi:hypothetical protein
MREIHARELAGTAENGWKCPENQAGIGDANTQLKVSWLAVGRGEKL